MVHIGIALGMLLVFYKLFIQLGFQFFSTFKDIFTKQIKEKKTGSARKFMYFTLMSLAPMLLYAIPAGKYGNVYGFLRFSTYNGTILDDGIMFVVTGGLLMLAVYSVKQDLGDKEISVWQAVLLGFAAFFAIPVAGLSLTAAIISLVLIFGASKKYAVRYAVTLSVPMLIVVGIIELCTAVTPITAVTGILSIVISAAVSFFVTKLLMWLVNNGKLSAFAYYDFGLGALCIIIGIAQLVIK